MFFAFIALTVAKLMWKAIMRFPTKKKKKKWEDIFHLSTGVYAGAAAIVHMP